MAAMIEYVEPMPPRYAELGWVDLHDNADWLVSAHVVYKADRRDGVGPSASCTMYWPPYPWAALEEAEKLIS